MMGWGIARSLVGLGVAGMLFSLPGDIARAFHAMPPGAIMPPGVVQLSEREWRLSRLGMVLRLVQEHVQIYDVLDNDLTPLYNGDRLAGYRLGNVERCPLFKEFGLRNGDILRAVNGESLQSLWEMYLRFRYVSQADVTVERQGQTVTLRYWIN